MFRHFRSRVNADTNSRPRRAAALRVEALEDRVVPAGDLVLNVNSTADDIAGLQIGPVFVPLVTAQSDRITLREAVFLANAAPADTNVSIHLQPNATYTLTRDGGLGHIPGQDHFYDDLNLARGVTVHGHGATVRGVLRGAVAIDAPAGQTITFIGLTVADSVGHGMTATGGADLTLTDVHFVNNRRERSAAEADTPGQAAQGAALIVDEAGPVRLIGGRFEGNVARGGAGSGADAGDDGAAGGWGYGAAIYSRNTNVAIKNTRFLNNLAAGGAGGFADDDDARGGTAGDGLGGAIYARFSVVTVDDAVFDNNQAGSELAVGGEGRHDGDSAGTGGGGYGGAVYLGAGGRLISSRTIFHENLAQAGPAGFGRDAEGGAVWTATGGVWAGAAFEDNSAIAGDGAAGGVGRGGAGGAAAGGADVVAGGDVRIGTTVIETSVAAGGNGATSATIPPRLGGRGGDARGVALLAAGTARVTLTDGAVFILNSAVGGDGGSAGPINVGTHGDGGDGFGGAVAIDGGAEVVMDGGAGSVDVGGNTASGGNAGQPAAGRDTFAAPGRGGDGTGGAVYAAAGFTAAAAAQFLSNYATAGMGSSGVTTRTFTGTYRINADVPATEAVNPILYHYGARASDSGTARGGAIYAAGDVSLVHVGLHGNRAVGFRGEPDDVVLPPDSGTTIDGTSHDGAAGGSGYGIQREVRRDASAGEAGLITLWRGTARGGAGGRGGEAVGGALYLGGASDLTRTFLSDNVALGGRGSDGGSGISELDLDYTNEFGGGGGGGGCGALAAAGGTVRVTARQAVRNAAVDGDGGNPALRELYGNPLLAVPPDLTGGHGGAGGPAHGGAAWLSGATTTVDGSTFAENTVSSGWGGAGGSGTADPRYNAACVAVVNVFSFGARGGSGGVGGFASDGARAVAGGRLDVTNSTVAGNRVLCGVGGYSGNGGSAGYLGGIARDGGDGRAAVAGGLAASAGAVVSVTASTVVKNGVETGGAGLPGKYLRPSSLSTGAPLLVINLAEWNPNLVAPADADPAGLTVTNERVPGGLRITLTDRDGRVVRVFDLPDGDLRLFVPYGAASVLADGTVAAALGDVTDPRAVRPALIFPDVATTFSAETASYADAVRSVRTSLLAGVQTAYGFNVGGRQLVYLGIRMADGVVSNAGDVVQPVQAVVRGFGGDLRGKAQAAGVRVATGISTNLAKRASYQALLRLHLALKLGGPASIVASVGVEVGTVVAVSLIYGKGDFVMGLRHYAAEQLLDPDWLRGPGGAQVNLSFLVTGVDEDHDDGLSTPPCCRRSRSAPAAAPAPRQRRSGATCRA